MPVLDAVLKFGQVVDLVGGIAFTALGFAMAFVRPRRLATLAFAAFAVCFGGAFLLRGLDDFFPGMLPASEWTAMALEAASVPALVFVACTFPASSGPRVRKALVLAGILATGFATWWFTSTLYAVPVPRVFVGDGPGFFDGLVYPLTSILLSAGSLAFAGFAWALVHMALPETRAAARRSGRRVAGALGFFFAMRAGLDASFTGSLGNAGGYTNYFGILTCCAVIATLWAVQAGRKEGGHESRNLALLYSLLPILSLAFGKMAGGGHEVWGTGLLGLGRILMVFAIAYGILREHLFDIDVRLKWTLSRSTVAALFVAVFFAVSESVQAAFSARVGTYSAIAATALLLIAIAPIQRAAERLSDKAMPSVRPDDPAYVLAKKREAYRNAYATAWADGTMTQKDARMLHQVRDALRLSEKDIVAIEREWARPQA